MIGGRIGEAIGALAGAVVDVETSALETSVVLQQERFLRFGEGGKALESVVGVVIGRGGGGALVGVAEVDALGEREPVGDFLNLFLDQPLHFLLVLLLLLDTLLVCLLELLAIELEVERVFDSLILGLFLQFLVHVGFYVIAKEVLLHVFREAGEKGVLLEEFVGELVEGAVVLFELAYLVAEVDGPIGGEECVTQFGDEFTERHRVVQFAVWGVPGLDERVRQSSCDAGDLLVCWDVLDAKVVKA